MTDLQNKLINVVSSVLNKNESAIDVDTLNIKNLALLSEKYECETILIDFLGKKFELSFLINEYYKLFSETSKQNTFSENQLIAIDNIDELFKKENIKFRFLKGAGIKKLYPNHNYRTMHDIDLVIAKCDYQRGIKLLEAIGYSGLQTGLKHNHLYNDNNIHLELHKGFQEPDEEYYNYYSSFDNELENQNEFKSELSKEDQYIYSIVHIKEHFLKDVVIFRMVMDTYVFNKFHILNKDYISKELEKLNLSEFEQNVRKLAYKWFDSTECKIAEDDDIYLLSEHFLGNLFKGISTKNLNSYLKFNGSKFRMFISSVFPPMNKMKNTYLFLNKIPILLPVAWGMRIFSAFFRRKENVNERKKVLTSFNYKNKEDLENFKNLINKYGLM